MSSQKFGSPSEDSPQRLISTAAGWRTELRRAERHIEKGNFDSALRSLETAKRSGADTYLCTLRMASLYRQLQRWPEAVEAAEQATLLDPKRLSGWEILLEFAEETGDRTLALAASKTLLQLSPRHIPAHIIQANAHMKEGNTEAALRVLNTLIRLSPESPDHHFHKAQLSQHVNDIPAAVEEFIQVIRLDPSGEFADEARMNVEALDLFQLSQIAMLASEDPVFRAKLFRNCLNAIDERGYYLGPLGEQLLIEFCEVAINEFPSVQSPVRYH